MQRAVDGGEADLLVVVDKRLVNVLSGRELVELPKDLDHGGTLTSVARAELRDAVVDGHGAQLINTLSVRVLGGGQGGVGKQRQDLRSGQRVAHLAPRALAVHNVRALENAQVLANKRL